MVRRTWTGLIGLLVAMALIGAVFAQEAEEAPPDDTAPTGDSSIEAPVDASTMPSPTLFVRVVDPADEDVEVPPYTASIALHGLTLPGAVLSVDGELIDVDEQGAFAVDVPLEEGANEIELVASDADGATAETTVRVLRGE